MYAPAGKRPVALNGSGRAPRASDPDKLLAEGLTEIPGDGPHAVTIPGAIDAWCRLHDDYGSVAMDKLLAPAIGLADNGCIVTPRVAFDWANQVARLTANPSTRDFFLPAGKPLAVGDRFANPALAETMKAPSPNTSRIS